VIKLGESGVMVSELCLGGNVFGWTADEAESHRILDAYLHGGGNFVDTADVYSRWADGNTGGESEVVIGRWLSRRGRRDDVVIATKVGQLDGFTGLSAKTVVAAAEESLKRLQTDHIDLYYAHIDDEATPLEETLEGFDTLVTSGKVRCIGASNYVAARLSQALSISTDRGLASYVAVQTHYNLVHRREFEDELADLCAQRGVACVAYSALADGFLTGKYRRGSELPSSERREDVEPYLTPAYDAVLTTLDEVAAHHQVPVAAVALGWLAARPGVVALASARTLDQLAQIAQAQRLELTAEEMGRLDSVTAGLQDVVAA
jgi:aryl-alcohol dehydrogenase-like predicted oxidoreductase